MKRLTFNIWVLRIAAAFALVWSILRAVQQAITLDEADTYLWFAGREAKWIWYPLPNNHFLNTLLMWLSTHVFGTSALTVRLPALLGAALYISVAYFLCRAITDRFALQFATLICLVYNPFVLDYFAAARGYSLANAFLLTALAIPVWHTRAGRKSVPVSSALASAATGLSFASNLSFAFVDSAALLVIVIWAIRQRGLDSILRIIGCCTLPALVVSLGMCGYPIAHYPRNELWYGARSLSKMTQSLVDASLYRLCGPLANSEALESVGRLLLLALGVLCTCRLILGSLDREFRRNVRARIAASLAGILILTLTAHYLAFRVAKLPLPMSRTGIFILPLCTLLIAVVAASPAESLVSRLLGHVIAGVFLCLAAHYLLCLRYTYFREYEKAADMKEVYRVIEGLNQTYGTQDFTADGAYASPLNFYRAISKTDKFPPLPGYPGMVPPGKAVYILHGSYYRAFMDEHKLVVVYRGRISQVVVAVPADGSVPPLPIAPSPMATYLASDNGSSAESGIAFPRLMHNRIAILVVRGIMVSYRGFRRARILVSVGALVLTSGCRRAREQPEAGSQASEAAPRIGAVSPMSGAGHSQAFRVVASHLAGATAIVDLQVLIDENMTATGSGACWIDVNSLRTVAVRNETGSDWLPSVRIGSAGTAVNSKCSIDAGGVKVETNGTGLAVTLPVTFAAAFKGAKKVWVVASGPRNHSGWQERSTWTAN